MSYEELDRVSVIERVIDRRLTQREAARLLGLTSRQVRRLRQAYERDGPEGLASKHRGRPSNKGSSGIGEESRVRLRLAREAVGIQLWGEGFRLRESSAVSSQDDTRPVDSALRATPWTRATVADPGG
jgi:transposase-like protein